MIAEQEPQTAICPNCGAKLVTEGLADGTTILCAACRFAFVPRPAGGTCKFSRKAIASLALGLASVLLSCLAAVPGVLLGIMALVEITRREEEVKGRRIAMAGIAASCLLGTLGAAVVWALLLPAIQMLHKAG